MMRGPRRSSLRVPPLSSSSLSCLSSSSSASLRMALSGLGCASAVIRPRSSAVRGEPFARCPPSLLPFFVGRRRLYLPSAQPTCNNTSALLRIFLAIIATGLGRFREEDEQERGFECGFVVFYFFISDGNTSQPAEAKKRVCSHFDVDDRSRSPISSCSALSCRVNVLSLKVLVCCLWP